MRITVTIPDDVWNEAMEVSREPTKRQTVIRALEEFVRDLRRQPPQACPAQGGRGTMELDLAEE